MTALGVTPFRPFDRKLPPVVEVAMVALAAAVTGGVILAAQATEKPSLVLPTVLMVVAAVLELATVVLAMRIRPFAWDRFRQVYGWGFVAYSIQGGMIEWSFAKNHTPAGPLTLLTIGLVVFATIVPLMIAFIVARYQAVTEPATA